MSALAETSKDGVIPKTPETAQDPRVDRLKEFIGFYTDGSWRPKELEFYIRQLRGENPSYQAGRGIVSHSPPATDFPVSTDEINILVEQAGRERLQIKMPFIL